MGWNIYGRYKYIDYKLYTEEIPYQSSLSAVLSDCQP